MNMKTEVWNGHEIRFVERDGEWWAVAKDVSDALAYRDAYNMTRYLDGEEKGTLNVSTLGGNQDMTVISESGIYEAIFNSRKPEAKEFKRWVKQIIKSLRQATGLEGFQIFRMLDKEHQKQAMERLHIGFEDVGRSDYMQANEIANTVTSMMYNSRTLKKNEMPPEWLPQRQQILDEVVNLMVTNNRFKLRLPVTAVMRKRYC